MKPEQVYFLRQHSLPLYVFTLEDLNLLKTIVDEELELRQDIRNKELKIELAKKVEAASGNDQHIEDLKQELFLARQTYAKRISEFDDYRHYPGYAQRDVHGNIASASEDDVSAEANAPQTLQVIPHDTTPHWQVSQLNEDGTETVIGIQ